MFIAETQYETVNNTNCTWICPKCEFFNFSDSFCGEQVNLETENRSVPLTKEKKDRSSPCGTNKSKKISNDQELIQSDPTSCPKYQKGNN